MPRLTVTITDEQAELLEAKTGDDGAYESKSEAVRDFIHRGERLQQRVEELEREVERLKNEKRLILEQREENTELARYVDEERTWRRQPLTTRLKWWVFGAPKDAEA